MTFALAPPTRVVAGTRAGNDDVRDQRWRDAYAFDAHSVPDIPFSLIPTGVIVVSAATTPTRRFALPPLPVLALFFRC